MILIVLRWYLLIPRSYCVKTVQSWARWYRPRASADRPREPYTCVPSSVLAETEGLYRWNLSARSTRLISVQWVAQFVGTTYPVFRYPAQSAADTTTHPMAPIIVFCFHTLACAISTVLASTRPSSLLKRSREFILTVCTDCRGITNREIALYDHDIFPGARKPGIDPDG